MLVVHYASKKKKEKIAKTFFMLKKIAPPPTSASSAGMLELVLSRLFEREKKERRDSRNVSGALDALSLKHVYKNLNVGKKKKNGDVVFRRNRTPRRSLFRGALCPAGFLFFSAHSRRR